MKILSRSFSAEILVLQGFPVRLRDSCFFRDKSGYPEIQDNQTFSIAGSRKGFGDPRGTLFFELARLAETRKPAYTTGTKSSAKQMALTRSSTIAIMPMVLTISITPSATRASSSSWRAAPLTATTVIGRM